MWILTQDQNPTEDPTEGQESQTDSANRLNSLGAWLAGGVAILTGALTALGIASGDIERVLRNQPREAAIWLAMIGFGILAGAIVWKGAGGNRVERLQGSNLVLAALAVGAIGLFAIWPVLFDASSDSVDVVEQQPWRRVWLVLVLVLIALTIILTLVGRWAKRSRQASTTGRMADVSQRVDTRLDLQTRLLEGDRWLILLSGLGLAYIWLRFVSTGRNAALLVAIWFGLLTLLMFKQKIQIEVFTGLLVVGFLSFLIGTGGFFKLGIENTSAKDRPTVTAILHEDERGLLTLDATVHATGLLVSEHVVVAVEGLNSSAVLSDVFAGPGPRLRDTVADQSLAVLDSVQLLHLSRTGADQSGEVNVELELPIGGGLYERLRVSAFLASPDARDIIGQLESARTRIESELQREADAEVRLRDSLPDSDWQLAQRIFEAALVRDDLGSSLRAVASHHAAGSTTSDAGDSVWTQIRTGLIGPPTTVVRVDPNPLPGATTRTLSDEDDSDPDKEDKELVKPPILASWSSVLTPWLSELTDQSQAFLAEQLRQAFALMDGLETAASEQLQTSEDPSAADPAEAAKALKKVCGHLKIDCERKTTDDEEADLVKLKELRDNYNLVEPFASELQDRVDTVGAVADEAARAAMSLLDTAADRYLTDLLNENHAITYEDTAFSSQAALADVLLEIKSRGTLLSLLDDQERLENEFVRQRRGAQACNETVQRSGCTIVLVPEVQKRPTLEAALSETNGSRTVNISLTATEVSASDFVHLTVLIGESDTVVEHALEAIVGASRPGKLAEDFPVRLPASATYVCAWATLNRNVIVRSPATQVDQNGAAANPCTVTRPDRAQIELYLPASVTTSTVERTMSGD